MTTVKIQKIEVLAKRGKNGISAFTFSNKTQASQKAEMINVCAGFEKVTVYQFPAGRAFYIRIK